MLSKKTKYAIKALSFIAKKADKTPMQIAVISEAENIPHKFLEAILLDLRRAGYLGAKRGKGGGYYLIDPPEKIYMSDILRLLDGPIAMVPCVSLNFYEKCDDCEDEEKCSVHNLMLQVRDSTLKILRNKSLADLIKE